MQRVIDSYSKDQDRAVRHSRLFSNIIQELSYRKQIAHKLRTQYAEGICDNTVTLKSRLTVTQGHWKRNH